LRSSAVQQKIEVSPLRVDRREGGIDLRVVVR
jgi:hypothetical protein